MFQLKKLSLVNFRSYRGTHEFEFPLSCGLYFLTGINNVELGSNGAGKSTLLDAIVWALYGRTARGLKGPEVVNWAASGCSVTLELTVVTELYTVTRTQRPNSLSLNGRAVDQDELQKHIRLNCEAFLYSVTNTQFGESFLALSPSAKLSLFSDIMGLDFWLEKSDEANKLAKAIEIDIVNKKVAASKYDAQQLSLREDIISLKEDETAYAAKHAEDRKQLGQQAKALHNEETKAVLLIDDLTAQASWLPDKIKMKEAIVTSIIDNREMQLKIIEGHSTTKKTWFMEREHLQATCDKLQTMRQCPRCLQEVDAKHVNKSSASLLYRIKHLELKMERVASDMQQLTKGLIKIKMDLEVAEQATHDLRKELTVIKNKIAVKEATLKTIGPRMDELGERLHKLEREENPYSKMLADKRAKLVAAREALSKANEARYQLEQQYEAVSYWVKGFKRVRLFIIEQAFRTLEVEVNNSLSQLGMSDWQITFDVERENKSGGVTKGFVVFVKSPNNTEPVKWENWSGGETQRLQLAGDLGLANLIMTQNGLVNGFEAYDEPSKHLSPEGMLDLANLLHDRAITENKQIWIVDHSSITNFGEFEGSITVRKTANGSNISSERRVQQR